jgi:hypothetical protein
MHAVTLIDRESGVQRLEPPSGARSVVLPRGGRCVLAVSHDVLKCFRHDRAVRQQGRPLEAPSEANGMAHSSLRGPPRLTRRGRPARPPPAIAAAGRAPPGDSPPNRTRWAICTATAVRMKYSPWPVQETATMAVGPGPGSDERASRRPVPAVCRTPRPSKWPPPVGPRRPRTTQPTVPVGKAPKEEACGAMVGLERPRLGEPGRGIGDLAFRPWARAKAMAPSPASITCGVFSITARAARIGLWKPCRAATDPARRVDPSIRLASSS